MPARQRNRVKPAIEMLEAVPTVVLGFIAGLWAAPLLQQHLLFVLTLPLLIVVVPLLLSALHLLLQLASPRFVRRPPRVLLLTVAYLVVSCCCSTSPRRWNAGCSTAACPTGCSRLSACATISAMRCS
jgi:ABC-type uncharacterized transport system permease subunit